MRPDCSATFEVCFPDASITGPSQVTSKKVLMAMFADVAWKYRVVDGLLVKDFANGEETEWRGCRRRRGIILT